MVLLLLQLLLLLLMMLVQTGMVEVVHLVEPSHRDGGVRHCLGVGRGEGHRHGQRLRWVHT